MTITKIKTGRSKTVGVSAQLPPQAKDLEQAVLGALLMERDALPPVSDILKSESFYWEAHRKIFSSMQKLFHRNLPVDLLTVAEELKKAGELEGAGGHEYLLQLTDRIGSAANVEYHARIVQELFLKREMIRAGTEIIHGAYDNSQDVFEQMDRAEQQLYSLAGNCARGNTVPSQQLVMRAIEQLDKAMAQKGLLTGVGSGFKELDRATGGWQPSDLVIIAGRPGMGKTGFALSMARNAAVDFKKPVAIFSLEMSSLQLANRLIAAEARIGLKKIMRGNLSTEELRKIQSGASVIREAPLYMDDTAGLNVLELRSRCRKLKQQYGIELFVVDYLQLMNGIEEGGRRLSNRENEISHISRSLKNIAKELNTPVIALSQLSREVEKRSGKRPQLSDLRESGAIEQDADMVIFVYRPEYYGIEWDEKNNSTKAVAEIIISKHRNGGLGSIKARFVDWCARFTDEAIEEE